MKNQHKIILLLCEVMCHNFFIEVVALILQKMKGDGFIGISKIKVLTRIANVVLGVALLAASFFVLRGFNRKLLNLRGRIEELEYDHLCEAYKQ